MLELLAEEPVWAVDTETYGLGPYSIRKDAALCPHMGRISLLQLKGKDSAVYVLDILQLEQQGFKWDKLTELLATRERLIFANAQFDLRFLKRHTGRLFWNVACVVSLSRLLGNATGSKLGKSRGHGLAALVRDYFNIHLEGKGSTGAQGSVWHVRPLDLKKLAYAAKDVEFLIPLYDILSKVISQPLPSGPNADPATTGWGMSGTMQIEMLMTVVAAEIEYNGLPTSVKVFKELQDAIDLRLGEVTRSLCERLDLEYDEDPYTQQPVMRNRSTKVLNNPKKLVAELNQRLGLNLDGAQADILRRLMMLMEAMEYDDDGELTTRPPFVRDEADFFNELTELDKEAHALNVEIIELILEYKSLNKQRGMDLRRYINPVTGRIHCSFNTLGAATGRSSSARPNLQNVNVKMQVQLEQELDFFNSGTSLSEF